MTARRILVLYAHPSQERSEINRPLAGRARAHPAATLVDLYADYPDSHIDIDREQARLREHDVLMFLFPLFWYSTPALLKEWQDLVLEHGFAYGSEGCALAGKHFICACSAGGPAAAYAADGFNHYTLRELLRPLEQTATLCHMHYLPPFALFAARTAVQEGRREAHLAAFTRLLDVLSEQPLDTWTGSGACTSNGLLDAADLAEGGAR
jgi:glutathione-regulated potassium-efflux system ancillary protein KefG